MTAAASAVKWEGRAITASSGSSMCSAWEPSWVIPRIPPPEPQTFMPIALSGPWITRPAKSRPRIRGNVTCEMTQCDARVAGIDARCLDFDAHVTRGERRVLHLADLQVFERTELLDS